jgi:hypothetical protein
MISFGLRDLPEDQGKIIGYLTTFFGAARRAQTGGAMNR